MREGHAHTGIMKHGVNFSSGAGSAHGDRMSTIFPSKPAGRGVPGQKWILENLAHGLRVAQTRCLGIYFDAQIKQGFTGHFRGRKNGPQNLLHCDLPRSKFDL